MKIKNFSFVILLAFLLGIEVLAPSCSKDDSHEEVIVSSPVVGTKWIAEKGKYLYFKTPTSGIYYEGDSYDKGDPYEDFRYSFNTKDNTILLLFGDEYESAQYTSGYILWGNKKFYKQ